MRAPYRNLVAGLVLSTLLLGAVGARAELFKPETFTLRNGLQVVVIPNHRVPVVSHMLWYRVGSADEVAGKTGLAHMVEHMMFKGTKTVGPEEFSRIVAANGGRDNAFTNTDYTAFFQNVAAGKLELVMRLEADRLANLALQDKDFQPERQVVIEERRMRIENAPEALLEEQMRAAMFLDSSYHHPVIGWHHDIDDYHLADVVAFHQRWYAPNNALLIVSGDITAAQLKPLAEKYYGVIPARPVPVRLRAPEPAPVAARSVEVRAEDVHQPAWYRDYLAPSYHAGDVKDAYPLQILADIMGGGATSRLYRTLVVERKLAASASAEYDPDGLGESTFSIATSPNPGVSMEALAAAMDEAIKAVAADGVTADEVERAKRRLHTEVVYAKDSYHTGAYVFGEALTTGSTVADVEAWPERIAAVTVAEVNAAARRLLRDERSVTGRLLPAKPGEATVTLEPGAGSAGGLAGKDLR
jgi:zinc protease